MKLHCFLLCQIRNSKPQWIQRLHTSSSEESTTFNEVLTIIRSAKPMEPALEPILPFLCPHVVTSLIKNPPDLQLGFRFFIWASQYKRFCPWKSYSVILDMLIKDNSNGLELYWQVLKEIKECNGVISADAFTVLIQAYAKIEKVDKALKAFELMGDFDCKPDVFTFNTILHLMVRKEFVLLALGIYNKMLKVNLSPNIATFSILIDGLCKSGKSTRALEMMFDEMVERGISPNSITYTIAISGLCQAGQPERACSLFNNMKRDGCMPDSITYNALLDGFCKSGKVDEAMVLLNSFEQDGFVLNKEGYSCLIDGFFRAGRYEDAQMWYRKMSNNNVKADVVLYTIMMKGLSKAGKVNDALLLLGEMTERGIVPDTNCYNALIKGFCDMGLLDTAKSLFLEISKNDCFPNASTYTILICGMCRNGLVGEAEKLFDEMEKLGCYPSVVTFNALIDGLCKSLKLEKAQLLFYKMEIGRNPSLFLRLSQGGNRVLDIANLQIMVEQLCDSGLILKAYNIFKQLADNGCTPDLRTYNILINGFCKVGNINGAFKLLRELKLKGHSPDSVTYGTLINGLFKAERDNDAFRLFESILKNGFSPATSVYKSLMTWACRRRQCPVAFDIWLKYRQNVLDDGEIKTLRGYFKKWDVEKAVRYLLEVELRLNIFQLAPYTIWLIGLRQAGKLNKALEIFSILKEYKIVVTPPSCVKLIKALCRKGNLELAAEIFIYTCDKGYIVRPQNCNRLMSALLHSKDKKHLALDVLSRMKSTRYDLNAHLRSGTKVRLLRGKIGKKLNNILTRDEKKKLRASIPPFKPGSKDCLEKEIGNGKEGPSFWKAKGGG